MRNIELKARLHHPESAEEVCRELGARCEGRIEQTDTYFEVPEGRLKLREQRPGNDQLIFYHRSNAAEPRASDYELARTSPELNRMLKNALSIDVVVKKVRTLWLWENVRIHLDQVDRLGAFIEFEAVLDHNHDDADGHQKLAHLQKAFSLAPSDVLATSYSDLLRHANR